MKTFMNCICLILTGFFFGNITVVAADFSALHSFTGSSGGANPYCPLVSASNILYGTALNGGSSGDGVIFKINNDGTGFTNMHNFTGGNDGANPYGGMIESNGILYGMTSEDGHGGFGTIFEVHTDGTGYTNIYSFTRGSDGAFPQANPILSGNTLYGTAYAGGAGSDFGTVFKINTDGTGFTTLHSFVAGNDGAYPYDSLVLLDGVLYGTTYFNGTGGNGTIFKINTDGSGYTNIYSFTRGNDGAFPQANLIICSNTLYGCASYGGANDAGTVFKINTDGTGFTTLYSFENGSDGANPFSGLILMSNILYGTTSAGGDNGFGAIFKINTDSTGFTTLYSLTGGDDGNTFSAGLIFLGGTLFGTTTYGGNNDDGTVFALNLLPSLPVLNLYSSDNAVVLTWSDPTFSLQSAPTPIGDYTNVIGATSPYTNDVSDTQKFFRLQSN